MQTVARRNSGVVEGVGCSWRMFAHCGRKCLQEKLAGAGKRGAPSRQDEGWAVAAGTAGGIRRQMGAEGKECDQDQLPRELGRVRSFDKDKGKTFGFITRLDPRNNSYIGPDIFFHCSQVCHSSGETANVRDAAQASTIVPEGCWVEYRIRENPRKGKFEALQVTPVLRDEAHEGDDSAQRDEVQREIGIVCRYQRDHSYGFLLATDEATRPHENAAHKLLQGEEKRIEVYFHLMNVHVFNEQGRQVSTDEARALLPVNSLVEFERMKHPDKEVRHA